VCVCNLWEQTELQNVYYLLFIKRKKLYIWKLISWSRVCFVVVYLYSLFELRVGSPPPAETFCCTLFTTRKCVCECVCVSVCFPTSFTPTPFLPHTHTYTHTHKWWGQFFKLQFHGDLIPGGSCSYGHMVWRIMSKNNKISYLITKEITLTYLVFSLLIYFAAHVLALGPMKDPLSSSRISVLLFLLLIFNN